MRTWRARRHASSANAAAALVLALALAHVDALFSCCCCCCDCCILMIDILITRFGGMPCDYIYDYIYIITHYIYINYTALLRISRPPCPGHDGVF